MIMKLKNCSFLFITGILLFAACAAPDTENVSTSLKTPKPTQNSANNASNNARNAANTNLINNSANGNLNAKANDEKTNDKSESTGTAGITDKKNQIEGAAVLKEVRAAARQNASRVVFEFEGAEMPGYHIEYIDKPVRACGSGEVVPLKGDAWLEIRFYPAQAHTDEGQPTVKNREQSPNLKIIKEMKLTCDFEAEVEWVLGVSSPNKYRVLELKNPTRLAVDISH